MLEPHVVVVMTGSILAENCPLRNPNGYCPIHATGVKLEGPIVRMEQV